MTPHFTLRKTKILLMSLGLLLIFLVPGSPEPSSPAALPFSCYSPLLLLLSPSPAALPFSCCSPLLLLLSPRSSIRIGSLALSSTGLGFAHLRDWELAVPLPSNAFPQTYEWLVSPLRQVFAAKSPSCEVILF